MRVKQNIDVENPEHRLFLASPLARKEKKKTKLKTRFLLRPVFGFFPVLQQPLV